MSNPADWRGRIGRNLTANAASQIGAFALNLIAVPIFLRMLGSESYALIGFGITVQIWVNLLDLGFSPIFTRDMARMSAGVLDDEEVHAFLRSMDWILLGVNCAAGVFAFASFGYWSDNWFDAVLLGDDVIGQSMAMIIAFSAIRLASAFYRSGLLGLERQVSVAVVTTATNFGRLFLPIGLITLFLDVRLVFATWVAVSLIEVVVLRFMLGSSFPTTQSLFKFSLPTIRTRLALSGQIALSALLWTTVTQVDKLILSRSLSLGEYGYFSLAIVLAGGLAMVPVPVITAFQPQIAAAAALNDAEKVRRLFYNATRILAVTTMAPAIIIALNAGAAIFAWTGDSSAADALEPYLGAYLVATAILGFGSLLYSLQVAYGKVTLPLIANLTFAVLLVPLMIVVVSRSGASGAAYLWLGMTSGLAILYFPIVLTRFLSGDIWRWYLSGIALPGAAAMIVGGCAAYISDGEPGRLTALLTVVAALTAGCALAGVLVLLSRRKFSLPDQ